MGAGLILFVACAGACDVYWAEVKPPVPLPSYDVWRKVDVEMDPDNMRIRTLDGVPVDVETEKPDPNLFLSLTEDEPSAILAQYRMGIGTPCAYLAVYTPDGIVGFNHQDPNDPNTSLVMSSDSIRRLCASGRVCEVMGHPWKPWVTVEVRSDEVNEPGLLLYTLPFKRRCDLCGKQEVRCLTEWK